MMKKNLEIQDYEDKKGSTGKRYVRFKTSDGWMSCFDEQECVKLKDFEGKEACVEVAKSGEYFNIKKCYGPAEKIDGQDSDLAEVEVVKPGKVAERAHKGQNAMYISYAKDIFLELVKQADPVIVPMGSDEDPRGILMDDAIKRVKQARDAFD